MKAKLTLRIKGEYFNHQDVELPRWIHEMDFESNVTIRERFIEQEANNIRSMWNKQIQKYYLEYEITLEIASDPEKRPFQENPEHFIILTKQPT